MNQPTDKPSQGGFSDVWDEIYQRSEHLSVWPWSDLVSYVMRYARPSGPAFRVLELGCGAGANIPFFVKLGVDYYALEGSEHMTKRLQEAYPHLRDQIQCSDFTVDLQWDGPFDLIFDRGSLTANPAADIQRCLAMVHARLKPGGRYIGIDWFSTAHTDFQNGDPVDDPYTRCNYASGHLAGIGKVHFADEAHLQDLLHAFEILVLEHKQSSFTKPVQKEHAFWNFVARPKG